MTKDRREAALPLLYVALALVLYAPCLLAPIYLDDGPYVFGSAFLRAPAGVFWTTLFSPHYLTATTERTWQPLVTVLNRLFIEWPLVLRVLSVLLHAACGWLVLRLSGRAAAGALFLLFPLAVDAVFFATFKGHLLAAAAVLSSLLAWRSGKPGLSLAALGAGLLAKETAFVAGPLLFLYAALIERRRPVEILRALAPHAALAAAYLVVRFVWLVAPPALLVSSEPRPFAALAWYLGALVWPPAPGLFRALPAGDAWVLLLLAPYAGSLWYQRRERETLFFILWPLVALLPFLHLVPFAAKSSVADRYLYLAAAGVCWGLTRFDGVRARAALATLAVLWGWSTLSRTFLLRDPAALAQRGARSAPGSAAARLFEAETLLAEDDAAGAAEAAARLEPRDPHNWTWLAIARHAAKRPDAEEAFRKALAIQETPQAHANLGAYLEETGRAVHALKEYDRAIELAPGWEKPRRLAADLRASPERR